jgi:hypothetical protein
MESGHRTSSNAAGEVACLERRFQKRVGTAAPSDGGQRANSARLQSYNSRHASQANQRGVRDAVADSRMRTPTATIPQVAAEIVTGVKDLGS